MSVGSAWIEEETSKTKRNYSTKEQVQTLVGISLNMR